MPNIPTRKLGKNGPQVPSLGFGAMGLSIAYGDPGSEADKYAALDAAFDSGARFFDTAEVYGDNEELIGKWFKKRPEVRKQIFLATKMGMSWKDGKMTNAADRESIRTACDKSLRLLGVDYIDLYYCHRIAPDIPVEKVIEYMEELKKEGKIKYIGLSEASSESLRRADKVHHVDAMQVEYSPFALDIEEKQIGVLKTCRELGIAIVAYSPLGRGILTGQYKSRADFEEGDFRLISPRFSEENFPKNLELVDKIGELAKKKGVKPSQLTLAWILEQGDDIFVIPGSKRVKYINENAGAVDVKLTKEDMDFIRKASESSVPAGARYPEAFMKTLFADSISLEDYNKK